MLGEGENRFCEEHVNNKGFRLSTASLPLPQKSFNNGV